MLASMLASPATAQPASASAQDLAQALQAAGDAVTDESSAMEFVGKSPKLVRASAQNFKVTYPEDFALAAAVLSSRAQG